MVDHKKDETRVRVGSRTKARRRAVDILYEAEFRDVDPVEIVDERAKLALDDENQVKPVPSYTRHIIEGAAVELDAIDEAISLHLASDWRFDRLPAVERAVLRVSAWELLFNSDDVPRDVAVKEGIQLAAAYSHVKASGYVNAVLDGIARERELKLDRKQADEASARRDSGEAGGQAEEFSPELGDFLIQDEKQDD